jgi:photosystem II stability/assembly factor-like uncharacterized protein
VYRFALLLLIVAMTAGSVWAHDASSYGGVFRSRNLGGTWLRADVGLFLNAALVLTVDPQNGSHLLAGTDLGLLGSHNGGLSWTREAPDLIFGAVFAVTFLGGGERAICAAQSGVFRFDAGQWKPALAPEAAVPAKTLATGASADRIYLLGRDRLFTSGDSGRTFVEVGGRRETSAMTAFAIVRSGAEIIVAVIDGQIMTSEDGGQRWRPGGLGKDGQQVDNVVADAHVPKRVWATRAGRIYVSDELGSPWRAVGRSLPEPATTIRGIAANAEATTLVVTTNRSLYRSENGGDSWMLKEDNLPIHLEAGALAQDPSDAGALYAVYSLVPYSEVWRTAIEARNLLRRPDLISLAGRIGLCLLSSGARCSRGFWCARALPGRVVRDDGSRNTVVAVTPAPAGGQRRARARRAERCRHTVVAVGGAGGALRRVPYARSARWTHGDCSRRRRHSLVHHRSGRCHRPHSRRPHRVAADPGAKL